jgi:sulfur-oxidizing protein SoxY
MNMKRRHFIKISGALSGAAVLGLLSPNHAMAAWPETAFAQKNLDSALRALFGSNETQLGDISIKAPEIVEDGALVPVTISSNIADLDSISLFVRNNPQPLVCSFDFPGQLDGYVSTRIKMHKSSDIVAVVKANDKLFSASRKVNVVKGGC